jgi:hypothetical protein
LDTKLKVQEFLDTRQKKWMHLNFSPCFSGYKLDTLDTNWIQKPKVHKKNSESPCCSEYKTHPKVYPTRSRVYPMDTENIIIYLY